MKKLFDEIPMLEDQEICIRQICLQDADSLSDMIHNRTVYRYLPTFLFELQFPDIDEAIDKMYGDLFYRKESLILGIYSKAERKFHGLAKFYGYKELLHKTCIGYRLREESWGHGIASRAVALLVDYLYSQTNIEIITASTMVGNGASARVLQKNGFIRTASSVPEDWGYERQTLADKWFR